MLPTSHRRNYSHILWNSQIVQQQISQKTFKEPRSLWSWIAFPRRGRFIPISHLFLLVCTIPKIRKDEDAVELPWILVLAPKIAKVD
jgi:hypothetical protein